MFSLIGQNTSINQFPNLIQQSLNKAEDAKPNSISSNDSTQEPNPKRLNYILEDIKKSYSVYLILYEEKIKIKVYPLPEGYCDYFYEKEFSQEELIKKVNNAFKLCTDIEDSFKYFEELFTDKENKFSLKEEKDIFELKKNIKLSTPLVIAIPKKIIEKNLTNINQSNNPINNNYIIKNELIQDNKDIKHKNNNDKNISLNILSNKEDEYKDIENISPLNITDEKLMTENKRNKIHNFLYNNKEEIDIKELPEEQESENNELDEEKETSKKSLLNKSIHSKNNDEKKSNSSLLNKKRVNTSDLSDVSFNSISNENEGINNNNSNNNSNNNISKRTKNYKAKETILKIFSDTASVNSGGEPGEKFFIKVQKNLNLEKNKNKGPTDLSINQEKKNDELNLNEDKGIILFGEEDSSDYIKLDVDNIDLYSNKSNKSPTITPKEEKPYKINELQENNFKLNIFCNNNNEFPDKLISNNYNNCVAAVKNIEIKDGAKNPNNNNNSINYIYNNYDQKKIFFNNNYDNNKMALDDPCYYSCNKFNNYNSHNKSYRIIHKNYVEFCTTEISYLFKEENNKNNKNNDNSFSVDSNIISGYSEFDFIINYLKKKFNKDITDGIRIYQATENGPTAADFHRECNGNTNIVVLIKTKDGKKFGGYTSVGFSDFNRSYHDDTAFLFSIDKREIYPNIHGKSAVDSFYNFGPCFSGDSIKIFDNFLSNGGITTKNCANFEMNEDYQINSGKKTFEVEEIEVIEFLEKNNDDDNI